MPLAVPTIDALAGPLAVIAVFWLAALYLAKKFRGGVNIRSDASRSNIKIIATRPIGWQSSLIIVEAEGHRFLLGAGRHGLTPIGLLERSVARASSPMPVPVPDSAL